MIFDINVIATNRPVNLIDENIDIALRVRPYIEDSSLIARPLTESPSSLFISPGKSIGFSSAVSF